MQNQPFLTIQKSLYQLRVWNEKYLFFGIREGWPEPELYGNNEVICHPTHIQAWFKAIIWEKVIRHKLKFLYFFKRCIFQSFYSLLISIMYCHTVVVKKNFF